MEGLLKIYLFNFSLKHHSLSEKVLPLSVDDSLGFPPHFGLYPLRLPLVVSQIVLEDAAAVVVPVELADHLQNLDQKNQESDVQTEVQACHAVDLLYKFGVVSPLYELCQLQAEER